MLDDCIELNTLTRKTLTLRRQILEIRELRERERRNHVLLKQQYEQQMYIGSNTLRQIIITSTKFLQQCNNNNNNNVMTTANKPQQFIGKSSCVSMEQLKYHDYDEVIRTMRNQEILDTYIRVVCKQNHQELEEMKTFISKERMELKKRKNILDSVYNQLITIITQNVASYNEAKPQQKQQNSLNRLFKAFHSCPKLQQQREEVRATKQRKRNYHYNAISDDSINSAKSPTAVQEFPLSILYQRQ